ncbi:MAG: polysaccharide deacetylase family protein [Flavipsychrobacter sp.]|nr:polysaccharide deacetylase family protein [Flavipsychrobacter sp.]
MYPVGLVWDMPSTGEPTVYITLDDGPHPTATPFVLQELEKYDAKATFFCVGHNVTKYPAVYEQILQQGHATANHTFNHMNGWKTEDNIYLQNIDEAGKHINSNLFRPPYGLIKRSQVRQLRSKYPSWKIVMWTVLSGDFDREISPEKCLNNVLRHIKPGSIVLFHDSDKAWDRMSYALPKVLAHCQKQGWEMKAITG